MTEPLPKIAGKSAEQPEDLHYVLADDIYVKPILLKKAGMVMPQHSHTWDHATFIARGSVKLWAGSSFIGNLVAPTGVTVRAGVKHTFLALEPDTLVLCIHSVARTGEVEIEDEHLIEGLS